MANALNVKDWNLSKIIWPQKSIYDEVLDSSPAFGLIPKDPSFGELERRIAVGTGMPQGVGTKYEVALGNQSPSTAKVFGFQPKTLHVIISLDGLLVRQSRVRGHEGMIVEPYARESKLAIQQWKNEQSTYFFGNGGGSLGRIDGLSNVATNTIKLLNPDDIRHFQENQWLNLAASDGTETPLGSARTGKVRVVTPYYHGPLRGTLVLNQVVSAAIGGAANTDFLFRDGIYGDVIQGKAAWLPRGDPGTADPVTGITIPDTFLGVQRSLNPSSLSGIRYDGRKQTIFNAIMGAAGAIADARGKADRVTISTSDWQRMRVEQSGAGQMTRILAPAAAIGKYKPGMSYQAFEIEGPNGTLQVLADPWCSVGRGYVEMSETWTYACVGDLVALNGDPLRAAEFADALRTGFVGDGMPYCEAPLYNATVQFADGA